MEKTIKQKVILLLCAVMAACMLISGGLFFGNKVIAADEETETSASRKVDFYEANKIVQSNIVYYDCNNNGTRDSDEAFIYTNNGRLNPSQSDMDAALWWTAPSDGSLIITSIKLTHNIEQDKAEAETLAYDGVRFAVLKVATDGSFTAIFDWEKLMATKDCSMNTGKTHYVATVTKTNSTAIDLLEGEKIAVIVNNGGKFNNSLDQIVVTSTLKFTADGTATDYKFESTTASAHYTALSNGKEYSLGVEAINYYSWGSAEITAPKVKYTDTAGKTYDSYRQLVEKHTLISASDMSSDDKQFVGWRTAGNLYAAETEYAITQDVTFNAVIITLKTEEGAGLRISREQNDAGIRFVSNYDLSGLKNGEYSFGSIIAPANKITNEAEFVKDGTLTVKVIPAVNYKKNDDGSFTQNAVINNIPEVNYATGLQSRGYVTVKYNDNTEQTFYTNISDERSVAYVANALYDQLNTEFSFSENEDLKNVVEKFKNAYTSSTPEAGTEEN